METSTVNRLLELQREVLSEHDHEDWEGKHEFLLMLAEGGTASGCQLRGYAVVN